MVKVCSTDSSALDLHSSDFTIFGSFLHYFFPVCCYHRMI